MAPHPASSNTRAAAPTSATPGRVDTAALATPRAQRTWYIWRKYVSSSSRVAVLADTPSSPSGTGSPQNCSGDRSANCLGAGADEAPLAGARRAAAAAKPRIGARSSIEDVQRGAPLKAASMEEDDAQVCCARPT